MKRASLVHNPSAGDGNHAKEKLLKSIKKAGYKVDYISTEDEFWESFIVNEYIPDFIFIAGGDGTIRKVAKLLLQKGIYMDIPIFLFPLGTANNIAKTLKIDTEKHREIPQDVLKPQNFNFGKINGFQNNNFFIESVGAGIFPELIYSMKNQSLEDEKPADKLKRTLKTLHKIVKEFKAQRATLNIDGIAIQGSFLLIELMNIQSIGPNLNIAPSAKIDDGYFDLVLIRDVDRELFSNNLDDLIDAKLNLNALKNFTQTISAQKVSLKWSGDKVHVDDNLITRYSGDLITLEMYPKSFRIY